MDMALSFLPAGIFFVLTVTFGFWLSRSGKPYNQILFNIHKLIALGVVVITSLQILEVFKNIEVQSLLVVLIAVAAICVIALFASGALMSAGNPATSILLTTHQIAPVLLTVSMSVTIYLISVKTP